MNEKWIWLDMEMTGLCPVNDKILEIAVIVTDRNLRELERWDSAIYQSEDVLNNMNEWCKEHHGASGLTQRVLKDGIALEKADLYLKELVNKHFKDEKAVLCGNSIWQDRRFVENYLPNFVSALHYRMVDVSTLKTLFRVYEGLEYSKAGKHRALEDVEESIQEFRFYMEKIGFLEKL